jgi:hypothetical protein
VLLVTEVNVSTLKAAEHVLHHADFSLRPTMVNDNLRRQPVILLKLRAHLSSTNPPTVVLP